jgi:Ubiquinol-cytochrome c reductase 8 kDa, N-terminal
MINIASKAGSYLRATNQVVANGLRPSAAAVVAEKKKVTTESNKVSTLWSLSQTLPAQNVCVKAGLTSKFNHSSSSRGTYLFT